MSKINWADKRCKETVWLTPESILLPVREYFEGPIPLDPATETSNPTNAELFYTKKDNGLIKPWDKPVFINPPYGKGIQDWCEKIHLEATRKPTRAIIALLPCGSGRPGTKYWQKHMFQKHLNIICYVRGRINFLKADGQAAKGNTYPSQIMGFNVVENHFVNCFKHLGKILKINLMN
jgi:hypothetical protein